MVRKKYQKKYGLDMQALLDALATERQVAFVAGLSAGAPDAAACFERGRALLSKPRRECVELFLCEGKTFESIAAHTGYLTDDILSHVVAGVAVCVPGHEEPAGVVACVSEEDEPAGVVDVALKDGVSADEYCELRAASRRGRMLWWLIAAGVIAAAGVYIYIMSGGVEEAPHESTPPSISEIAEAVPPMEEESAAVARDSLPASTVGHVSIVSISREDDGRYTSTPLIGMLQYGEYLTNAAMPMDEASHGEVTMTFTVNRYGRPSGIRVVSVLTHDANHEAIRLLTNGPEWAESARQVTLTLRFM